MARIEHIGIQESTAYYGAAGLSMLAALYLIDVHHDLVENWDISESGAKFQRDVSSAALTGTWLFFLVFAPYGLAKKAQEKAALETTSRAEGHQVA